MTISDADLPRPLTVSDVVDRLELVNQRIEQAGGSSERTSVLAVTKTFPFEVAEVAASAGLLDLGENYAQELVAKADLLDRADVRWHMIGGLQRNKVKKLAGRVHVWQTVDRLELGAEVARRAPSAKIFVQVNTTAEPQKSGCSFAEAPELVGQCRELGLDVLGLMTVGPTDGSDPSSGFAALRELALRVEVDQLSMGMTADLEAAVAEGSTMVRVGTALFGPRPPKVPR